MKNDLVKFSANLKFIRNKKGLTQDQFAKKLKISRSCYGSYEEGRATPPYCKLIEISDILKVTIDRLLIYEIEFRDPAENVMFVKDLFQSYGIKPKQS